MNDIRRIYKLSNNVTYESYQNFLSVSSLYQFRTLVKVLWALRDEQIEMNQSVRYWFPMNKQTRRGIYHLAGF